MQKQQQQQESSGAQVHDRTINEKKKGRICTISDGDRWDALRAFSGSPFCPAAISINMNMNKTKTACDRYGRAAITSKAHEKEAIPDNIEITSGMTHLDISLSEAIVAIKQGCKLNA